MTNVTKTNRFLFTMTGFRELSYRVQSASIGGLNLGSTQFPGRIADLLIPSNKVDFGPLAIKVLLTENYTEWMDSVKWMYDLIRINNSHTETTSEGSLIVLNANNTPIMEIVYHSLAPINITQIDFALDQEESTGTFDLTMSFDSYDIINKITGETIVYGERKTRRT